MKGYHFVSSEGCIFEQIEDARNISSVQIPNPRTAFKGEPYERCIIHTREGEVIFYRHKGITDQQAIQSLLEHATKNTGLTSLGYAENVTA